MAQRPSGYLTLRQLRRVQAHLLLRVHLGGVRQTAPSGTLTAVALGTLARPALLLIMNMGWELAREHRVVQLSQHPVAAVGTMNHPVYHKTILMVVAVRGMELIVAE